MRRGETATRRAVTIPYPSADVEGLEPSRSTSSSPAQITGSIQDRVLAALRAHVVPALPSDLAATLAEDEKKLKRLLGKMARDGSVRRSGGGRFTTSRHYK